MVKGTPYRLEEFLFGRRDETKESFFNQKRSELEARGSQLKFIVLYLGVNDYHRFHSPATFTTNYRRHVYGFVEPVFQGYLTKHPKVLTENERVTLFGEWP